MGGRNRLESPWRWVSTVVLPSSAVYDSLPTGSVRQTLKGFHDHGIELPVDKSHHGHMSIVWLEVKIRHAWRW